MAPRSKKNKKKETSSSSSKNHKLKDTKEETTGSTDQLEESERKQKALAGKKNPSVPSTTAALTAADAPSLSPPKAALAAAPEAPKEPNNTNKAASASLQSFHASQPALSKGVLEYIDSQGFTSMTPVQAATLPLFLSHKDVAVQAVTGSGKTLAFVIPVVEFLQQHPRKRHEVGALILAPTRELAQQTFTVAQDVCRHCDMREPLLLVGGGQTKSRSSSHHASSNSNSRPVTEDLKQFAARGSDLIVGTPGRVCDVLTKYAALDCSSLDYLILDEADVLLQMGFGQTLCTILSKLPKMRRTGLFSATTATANASLQDFLQRAGLRNPVWIHVAVTAAAAASGNKQSDGDSVQQQQSATPTSLTNYVCQTRLHEKVSRLVAFLQDHATEKILVFFLTCASVEFYTATLGPLLKQNVLVEGLHGRLVQTKRTAVLQRFQEAPAGATLFCTDVAARGLHVPQIHWVVQFDAPNSDPSVFVHRVGRSARAGQSGKSLLFLTRKEEAYVDLLRLRHVPVQPLPLTERCAPPLEEDEDEKKDKKDMAAMSETAEWPSAVPGAVVPNVLRRMREMVLQDRDLLEKGTRAFTSYIRAYKEHSCAFIFRFASLDLGLLATSFCLLQLPKMPELSAVLQKHKGKLPRFVPAGREVDIFRIPYKDKHREAARQLRLQQEATNGGKSAKRIRDERYQAEKELKAKERRQAAVKKGRNPDKKRGRNAQLVDEWDSLAKEERLAKKLRQGKITQDQYDEQLAETV